MNATVNSVYILEKAGCTLRSDRNWLFMGRKMGQIRLTIAKAGHVLARQNLVKGKP